MLIFFSKTFPYLGAWFLFSRSLGCIFIFFCHLYNILMQTLIAINIHAKALSAVSINFDMWCCHLHSFLWTKMHNFLFFQSLLMYWQRQRDKVDIRILNYTSPFSTALLKYILTFGTILIWKIQALTEILSCRNYGMIISHQNLSKLATRVYRWCAII